LNGLTMRRMSGRSTVSGRCGARPVKHLSREMRPSGSIGLRPTVVERRLFKGAGLLNMRPPRNHLHFSSQICLLVTHPRSSELARVGSRDAVLARPRDNRGDNSPTRTHLRPMETVSRRSVSNRCPSGGFDYDAAIASAFVHGVHTSCTPCRA